MQRERPRGRLGAVGQPQLRGPDQPRREDELPGLAAAGHRLRARGHDGLRLRRPTRSAQDPTGNDVFLRDIWPSPAEVDARHRRLDRARTCSPSDYADVFAGDERWRSLPTPDGRHVRVGRRLHVRAQAAVLRRHAASSPPPVTDVAGARVLALLGDSVTTDHISPAGSIKADSPAGPLPRRARRRAQGLQLLRLAPRQPRGDDPRHVRQHPAAQPAAGRRRGRLHPRTSSPVASRTTIYDAAQAYAEAGVPLVILAGKEYGSGSSRDWAAKGTALLGVRVVIAESLRADPPLEPHRDGRAAAAVPGGGDRRRRSGSTAPRRSTSAGSPS